MSDLQDIGGGIPLEMRITLLADVRGALQQMAAAIDELENIGMTFAETEHTKQSLDELGRQMEIMLQVLQAEL